MSKEILKREQLQKYKGELGRMISDADFKCVFGDTIKILKYGDLAEYNTIYDLLNLNDFVVVLTEDAPGQGHWCALYRMKDGTVYWFDSYGVKVDGELKFIPLFVRQMLGSDEKHLTRLIRTLTPDDKKLFKYNDMAVQSDKEGVNTCGRWAIFFIKMCKFGYTLDEIIEFVEDKAELYNKPTDILVVDWVPASGN
jgi:hypothetical protein